MQRGIIWRRCMADYAFRNFLEDEMKKRSLSARQFADFVGVGHTTINRLIDPRNVVPPSMEVLLKVSNATKRSLLSLVELAYPNEVSDTNLSPSAQILAQDIEELPDNLKEAVLALVRRVK